MEWTRSSFSVSGNVKPGEDMITERLEWREERALIHSRLWSHTPQQTELHLRPFQAKIKTFIAIFEKCKHILKLWKVNLIRREPCNLTGIRHFDGELLCVWDAGADGGYLWRSMWILWMTSSLSSHYYSATASVSELSRLVTHTAVSSPQCNSEKRPFRTLFKWHRYCGMNRYTTQH